MKTAFAVFQIPETTIEINGIIKVYHNGEICEAIWHVPMQDVQKALLDGRENYFDPDDKYVLSEMRRYIDKYDMDWTYARDEAIRDVIASFKRA